MILNLMYVLELLVKKGLQLMSTTISGDHRDNPAALINGDLYLDTRFNDANGESDAGIENHSPS